MNLAVLSAEVERGEEERGELCLVEVELIFLHVSDVFL